MVHTQHDSPSLHIALLCSAADPASMNVYEHLISTMYVRKATPTQFHASPIYEAGFGHNSIYLILTKERSVYCENIDTEIETALGVKLDAIIFITKHDSKSGRPSFSVHTQGNWDKADLGGNIKELAVCPVVLKHILFQSLRDHNSLPGFEVVNECTHHGPSTSVPSMFIEIGSTQREWVLPQAAAIMVAALTTGLTAYAGESDPRTADLPTVIGLGGTHTCSNFARLVVEDKIYLSHVCPEYSLDGAGASMIKQAIGKSTRAPVVVIDWKGMDAAHRNNIVSELQTAHILYLTLTDLKKKCDAKISGKSA